jgi:TRAP-type C4-dicarboxylate transport system permease small subunit
MRYARSMEVREMSRFWELVQWIVDKLKIIGAACLVGMTFLTCADVVGRFFRHPIFGSVELVGFMATLAVAMALPYTQQIKGHIGVEILVRVFPKRTQAIIDICTSFLSLGLFVLVSWRMAAYGTDIQRSGEVSMNLQFPTYYIIYVAAFCFVIFTLIILYDIIDNLRKLRTP